ncbi:hypothetical protein [Halobacterium sp. R2-5]|uniref:hypothetical protein n=1 Tax=Halobacterium sp. R2-5 TaxID=2715751 RepID=UPI00141EA672|nr:hypothetical protein [Halobacterium sp. R2-5]NIC00250.1 hypothetical protein [Halobacterium sp. R2-5]
MEGTYDELSEDQELQPGQTMLKTFLIESNVSPADLRERVDITQTREVDFNLEELVIRRNGTNYTFFLDHEDSRFWTLYTLEESEDAKKVVADMVSGVRNGLDYTWMPVEQQRDVMEMGEFRDVGVSYDADDVFSEDYIEDRLAFGDLSVRSSGRGTGTLFDILDSHEELSSFLSLSSVGIKREVNGSFVLERVTHNGRFTTSGGDSIQLHLDTVAEIKNRYSTLLQRIEENHRLSYESRDHGTGMDGTPLVIELDNEIENVREFIENTITAKNPLRLWGAKTKLDDQYWKVKGIDLHNNDKYTIEICPEWLRLYLGNEACGNTALRIYSNLQRHYDSNATMEVQE